MTPGIACTYTHVVAAAVTGWWLCHVITMFDRYEGVMWFLISLFTTWACCIISSAVLGSFDHFSLIVVLFPGWFV